MSSAQPHIFLGKHNMGYNSWGNYPISHAHEVWPIYWHDQHIDFDKTRKNFLCYAQGRSYGDSCLNDCGILLDTQKLNRFMLFDEENGILRCESGITFADILRVIVPKGWFLPVVPGTQYISLGGAIANDIHGKNHPTDGTFGRHVRQFELLRSNGDRLQCSPRNNPDLFAATIGGLGLTGFISWAEIALIPIKTPYIHVEKIKFGNLEEYCQIAHQSPKTNYAYTVAWLDVTSQNNALGRGIFMRANHAHQDISPPLQSNRRTFSIPCNFPNIALNHHTIKAFNTLYFYKQKPTQTQEMVHLQTFFFQLDCIRYWNKIYGKRGFLQYQCVIPGNDVSIIKNILTRVSQSAQGSFLSVLKNLGDIQSPGLLSFPKQGMTLALDFPNLGQKTLSLLNELDAIVMDHNGCVYPAKDARMSSNAFKHYYPGWQDFLAFKDVRFTSSFWRRVTE